MRLLVIPVAALLLLVSACTKAPSTTSTPLASASTGASSVPSTTTPTSSTMTGSTTAASVPVGTVVDLPGVGVTFSTADQINAATWLSADERTFLAKQLAEFQAGGDKCASIVLSGYRVGDLMHGQQFESDTAPCTGGGGYAILWGKVSGTWKQLMAGQEVPTCADIRTAGWKTTIPKQFFGGTCRDTKGAEVEYTP
jgi:hypothetical protein